MLENNRIRTQWLHYLILRRTNTTLLHLHRWRSRFYRLSIIHRTRRRTARTRRSTWTRISFSRIRTWQWLRWEPRTQSRTGRRSVCRSNPLCFNHSWSFNNVCRSKISSWGATTWSIDHRTWLWRDWFWTDNSWSNPLIRWSF